MAEAELETRAPGSRHFLLYELESKPPETQIAGWRDSSVVTSTHCKFTSLAASLVYEDLVGTYCILCAVANGWENYPRRTLSQVYFHRTEMSS